MITVIAALCIVASVASPDVVIELPSVVNEYSLFLHTHGKGQDRVKDVRRLERFKHHNQIVNEHNENVKSINTEKLSFTLKLNPMADLLPEELDSLFGSKIGIQHAQTVSKYSSLRTHDFDKKHKPLPYYHSNFYPYVGGRNQAQKNELKVKSVPLPETLNWASGNNPIGNSVMSTVRNQVSGSC